MNFLKKYEFTLPKSETSSGPDVERGIYGFSIYLISWIFFGIYLAWAILPHELLNSLGFDYVPSRAWSIIMPWSLLCILLAGPAVYIWMNGQLLLPISSIHMAYDDLEDEQRTKHYGVYEEAGFQERQTKLACPSPSIVCPPMLDINPAWISRQLYLEPRQPMTAIKRTTN